MAKDLVLEVQDIDAYSKSSEVIDFESPVVKNAARVLAEGVRSEIELARKVYQFVRDDIAHSDDVNGDIVTCKASEVLRHRQGDMLCQISFAGGHPKEFGNTNGFLLSETDLG